MLIFHKLVASNGEAVLQAFHLSDVHATLAVSKEEEVRGERTKSGAEIMTSQDGCRCEL